MKTTSILPQLNLNYFYGFSRMKLNEQSEMLKEKGILIDEERENEFVTKLYFINGFFAEETVSVFNNATLEILPFRRGYKLDSYLEVKEVLTPKYSYQ